MPALWPSRLPHQTLAANQTHQSEPGRLRSFHASARVAASAQRKAKRPDEVMTPRDLQAFDAKMAEINKRRRSDEMTDEEVNEAACAALIVLARYNIPPDVQELLIRGNPNRDIRPGALGAAIRTLRRHEKVKNLMR
jgi:hypothetical protein